MEEKDLETAPKADTQIGIRVTRAFKTRLECLAERERRSVSNLVVKVLEEYMAGRGGDGNGTAPPL